MKVGDDSVLSTQEYMKQVVEDVGRGNEEFNMTGWRDLEYVKANVALWEWNVDERRRNSKIDGRRRNGLILELHVCGNRQGNQGRMRVDGELWQQEEEEAKPLETTDSLGFSWNKLNLHFNVRIIWYLQFAVQCHEHLAFAV
ncbi:hypothetical protein Tco_1408918 [Tanacetum coccineum]